MDGSAQGGLDDSEWVGGRFTQVRVAGIEAVNAQPVARGWERGHRTPTPSSAGSTSTEVSASDRQAVPDEDLDEDRGGNGTTPQAPAARRPLAPADPASVDDLIDSVDPPPSPKDNATEHDPRVEPAATGNGTVDSLLASTGHDANVISLHARERRPH